MYIYHIFLTKSSVDGHLGCFHVLAIAMNMWVHVSFLRNILSGYMPKSGTAGSYGSSMYSFLQITNAGGGVEKREPSCTAGGNVSWYNYFGEQYGGTVEIYT